MTPYCAIIAFDPRVLWEIIVKHRLNLIPILLLYLFLPRQRILRIQSRLGFDEAETMFFEIPFARVNDRIYCHSSFITLMIRGTRTGNVVNGHIGIKWFLLVEDGILG